LISRVVFRCTFFMARNKNKIQPSRTHTDHGVNIFLTPPTTPMETIGVVHEILRSVPKIISFMFLFTLFVLVNYFSNGLPLTFIDGLLGTNLTYYFPYLTISPFTWLQKWWKTGRASFHHWGWEEDGFPFFFRPPSPRHQRGGSVSDTEEEMPPLSTQVLNLVLILFAIIILLWFLYGFLRPLIGKLIEWIIKRKWDQTTPEDRLIVFKENNQKDNEIVMQRINELKQNFENFSQNINTQINENENQIENLKKDEKKKKSKKEKNNKQE